MGTWFVSAQPRQAPGVVLQTRCDWHVFSLHLQRTNTRFLELDRDTSTWQRPPNVAGLEKPAKEPPSRSEPATLTGKTGPKQRVQTAIRIQASMQKKRALLAKLPTSCQILMAFTSGLFHIKALPLARWSRHLKWLIAAATR